MRAAANGHQSIIESLPFERPQLGGAAELLHLFDLLNVRCSHPGSTSPISSRKIVPSFAVSKSPFFRWDA